MRSDERDLPDRWKMLRLCEIATVQRGKFTHRPRNAPEFYGGETPFVQTGDVATSGKYLRCHSQTLSERGLSVSKVFSPGTVLMVIAGSVGETTIATFPVAFPDSIVGFTPRIGFSPEFLLNLLRHIRPQIHNIATESAQANLSLGLIQSIVVRVPPSSERDRITEVLDSLDSAIEATRAVVDQTRQVRTALLQRLTTRGLPRQKSMFRTMYLGDIFQERKERGRPGLPIMAVTMNDGLVERTALDRRMETTLGPEAHLLARKGDIAYNMMRMWQGVFGLARRDCIVSPAYVVLQPLPGIVPQYAAYLFKHPATIRKFHLFSQGLTDDRLRLYFDQFKTIKLRILADETEQAEIANSLQAVDDRVVRLAEYCEQLARLKNCLSQALLTGRVRVSKGGPQR